MAPSTYGQHRNVNFEKQPKSQLPPLLCCFFHWSGKQQGRPHLSTWFTWPNKKMLGILAVLSPASYFSKHPNLYTQYQGCSVDVYNYCKQD